LPSLGLGNLKVAVKPEIGLADVAVRIRAACDALIDEQPEADGQGDQQPDE
jgi:hypothetical protein